MMRIQGIVLKHCKQVEVDPVTLVYHPELQVHEPELHTPLPPQPTEHVVIAAKRQ
jgi:hypothetical protein